MNQDDKPILNKEETKVNLEIKNKLEPNKPKKSDFVVIYVIATIIIGLIIGVCVFGVKEYSNYKENHKTNDKVNDKGSNVEETPKEETRPIEQKEPIFEKEEDQTNKPLKEITYYNKSSRTITDKLAFTLGSTEQNKGILIGITGKGIAQNVKGDSVYLKNEFISVSEYSINGLSLTYKQTNFKFRLVREVYKKDKSGEYLSDQLILYKDKNYIIVKGNKIENNDHYPYSLYYYYDTDKNQTNMWDLIYITEGSTVDDLKVYINGMRQDFAICSYDMKTGPSNCITDSNQKINYNEFKNFNDVIIDSLIDYNLYIDSYERITSFSSGNLVLEQYIYLEGSIGNDKVKYHVSFPKCSAPNADIKVKTTLNGSDFKLTKPYTSYTGHLTTPNGCTEIIIVLPSGVDKNNDNAMKVVRITFSKDKKN